MNSLSYHFDDLSKMKEEIGWGRYHWVMYFGCGIGYYCNFAWMRSASIIANQAGIELDLTATEESYMEASLMLGILLGSITFSSSADKYGRMPFFKTSQLLAGGFGMACAFSINLWMSCGCLFILGFFIGGDFGLVAIVFLETAPNSSHKNLATLAVVMRFGLVFLPILCIIFIELNAPSVWRYLTGTISVFSLLSGTLRLFLVETPTYYIVKRKPDLAYASLLAIAEINNKVFQTKFKETNLSIQNSVVLKNEYNFQEKLGKIFTPPYRRRIIVLSILWFCYSYQALGLPFYISFILMHSENKPYETRLYIFVSMIAQLLAQALGSVAATFFLKSSLGRKGTMFWSFVMGSISIVLLYPGSFSYDIETVTMSTWLFFLGISTSVFFVITPESFSNDINSFASNICNSFGKVGSLVAPSLTGVIFGSPYGFEVVISVFLGLAVVSTAMSLLVVETKGDPKDRFRRTLIKTFQQRASFA